MPIVALVDGKQAHLAMDGDGEFKVPEDMTNAEFFHSTAARAMAVYSSLPKNKSIFRFAMSWAGDLGFDASDFTHETNVTSSAEGAGEAAEGGGEATTEVVTVGAVRPIIVSFVPIDDGASRPRDPGGAPARAGGLPRA